MKKVLSLVLALGMAVSSVGMVSFAEEDAEFNFQALGLNPPPLGGQAFSGI